MRYYVECPECGAETSFVERGGLNLSDKEVKVKQCPDGHNFTWTWEGGAVSKSKSIQEAIDNIMGEK